MWSVAHEVVGVAAIVVAVETQWQECVAAVEVQQWFGLLRLKCCSVVGVCSFPWISFHRN